MMGPSLDDGGNRRSFTRKDLPSLVMTSNYYSVAKTKLGTRGREINNTNLVAAHCHCQPWLVCRGGKFIVTARD